METVVEVALPVAPDAPMLMGSPDGSGGGGRSGGVGGFLVRDRWKGEGCVGEKDVSYDKNTGVSASWPKCPEPNDLISPKRSSFSCKDLDGKCLLEKSSKKVRSNSGGTKRSRVVQEEVSKSKPGSGNADGSSQDFFSSSTNYSLSGKNQTFKQRHNLTCGRADKRNTKVKCKNRSETSFLKNGAVGFCSSLGGNNFSGICGQKVGVHEISKYLEELSLDELLQGSYSYTKIAEEKGKWDADSNDIVLQSVQKACSILRARKVLQIENFADLEVTGVQDASTGFPSHASEIDQTDEAKEDKPRIDQMACEKDRDSDGKIKFPTGFEPSLRHPRDVLDRLVLPQPTVPDLLLSDKSKIVSTRNSIDPRSAKMASFQIGLPPFPWSHSSAGNNKLGFDSLKSSACQAVCQGRWVNLKNSIVSQKSSADLLVDFESLKFNKSLVPPVSSTSEQPQDQIAATERCSSSSFANSCLEAHGDENSPAYAAAHTLLHIAAHSKEAPMGTLKSTRNTAQISMKASKINPVQRTSKVIVDSKSKTKQSNPLKSGSDDFPLKKPRLSTDVANGYIRHDESSRKGPTYRPSSSLFKSRHKKLFVDSNTDAKLYGSNLAKRSFIKPRQITEWPNSSRQKFWRSAA